MSKYTNAIGLADAIINDLLSHRQVMESMGRQFYQKGTITHEEISLIEPGKPFVIIPGITSYRIPTLNPFQVVLHVIMGPRAIFKIHSHDCPEAGTVIQGECEVNKATYKFMQSFSFNTGEEHQIYSEHGCSMTIDFGTPPKNKRA
ncbi:MAG: hypothetical protein AAFY91_06645 [Bacteroidota bacterium]